MNKEVETIVLSNKSQEKKLEALSMLENDIKMAMRILDGTYTYCEECKDFFLTESFLTKTEIENVRICTYSDPINSGGDEYVNGHAKITYRVCPKGHKHEICRNEYR